MPVDKGCLSSDPKTSLSVGQHSVRRGDGYSIGLSKTFRGAISDVAKWRV